MMQGITKNLCAHAFRLYLRFLVQKLPMPKIWSAAGTLPLFKSADTSAHSINPEAARIGQSFAKSGERFTRRTVYFLLGKKNT